MENNPKQPDFKMVEQACKLISKYSLKELTLHADGSITIVKEVHPQLQVKPSRAKRVKKEAPDSLPVQADVDLRFVASRLPSQKLNSHTRYRTENVLPNQGKE